MKENLIYFTSWYNFRTNSYDIKCSNDPIGDYSDYVSQGAGRSLYNTYLQVCNLKPIEAATNVLSIAVGEKLPYQCEG